MRQIEVCCMCGFSHRDDRTGSRQEKFHFHWREDNSYVLLPSGFQLLPTCCYTCIPRMDSSTGMTGAIDWSTVQGAIQATPPQYRLHRYNTTIPPALGSDVKAALQLRHRAFFVAMQSWFSGAIQPDAT